MKPNSGYDQSSPTPNNTAQYKKTKQIFVKQSSSAACDVPGPHRRHGHLSHLESLQSVVLRPLHPTSLRLKTLVPKSQHLELLLALGLLQ